MYIACEVERCMLGRPPAHPAHPSINPNTPQRPAPLRTPQLQPYPTPHTCPTRHAVSHSPLATPETSHASHCSPSDCVGGLCLPTVSAGQTCGRGCAMSGTVRAGLSAGKCPPPCCAGLAGQLVAPACPFLPIVCQFGTVFAKNMPFVRCSSYIYCHLMPF